MRGLDTEMNVSDCLTNDLSLVYIEVEKTISSMFLGQQDLKKNLKKAKKRKGFSGLP